MFKSAYSALKGSSKKKKRNTFKNPIFAATFLVEVLFAST